ncbi:LarC family nickel insertion protein [Saccharobesus litoralis]|uniref:LarC family nickel insertion protein n=1 Tax=Saccharobesus litoralis TaxID=2172099 RepID=A0A2S0VPF3_9ALTE|nr:LarC family nickel insertion protein [Saccharobesus litoralis]AWB66101.1 LarC family nickel insertion protein [Saccharobesus litoralis]
MSSTHIHLDIVGGIAGDMFIAAMLDCQPSLKKPVLEAVAQVIPDNIGQAELYAGINSGISGLKFKLALNNNAEENGHHHTHEHEHEHEHKHEHGHKHTHDHTHHEHEHSHSERTTYRFICQLINQSQLAESVKLIAIDLLTIIGKAEAKVHNKTLDDVHFHELADWDSVMDVVAIAVILAQLTKVKWSISDLPLGSGLVKTAHGLIPVPAPATAEILTGFRFIDDGVAGERITPTGAAILRYLKQQKCLVTRSCGVLQAIGYGLGTKQFKGMPNILRATAFTQNTSLSEEPSSESITVVEFDIDDMTGEELALAADKLRSFTGVVDLVTYASKGKKNRATESFRLLVKPQQLDEVVQACFQQTSTIGLRYHQQARQCLARTAGHIENLAVKWVDRPEGQRTVKVEHDELVSLPTLAARRAVKYSKESV